jgi:FkbM family methyltransferase
MAAFPIPSYSHSGEDRLVWKLAGYRDTGTYVDIGGYHPTDYSNTYLLYRAGWRGLVIDADNHFLPLYATLRPEDRVRHCAIAGTPGTATLHTFEDRSLNTLDPAVAAEYAARGSARSGQITVEAVRLEQALDESGIAQIDFLNIDVEGADLQVLQSNDWARWTPGIIAIEDHRLDLASVQASATWQYLATRGYFLQSKCNYTSVYCRR